MVVEFPQTDGLDRRISKTVPAATVVDSPALRKLDMSPVTLARFEADAGTTNRGNVRMELKGLFGGERTARRSGSRPDASAEAKDEGQAESEAEAGAGQSRVARSVDRARWPRARSLSQMFLADFG